MALNAPANWPVPIPPQTLSGRLVRLESLSWPHLAELTRIGDDPAIWEFTTSRADSTLAMRSYFESLFLDWQRGEAVPFAVRRLQDAALVGCTRIKALSRTHRNGIVGSWYVPSVWRTGVNLEAKLLLLDFAFLELECVRIEFHTDARNQRSRSSLEKLGAQFEGILRAHQITPDGHLRDSAIYSILQKEWQQIRPTLLGRLNRYR